MSEKMRYRSNVNNDVEAEILLRLPVKSLVRFKCVCKTWEARFREPTFIEAHHRGQGAIDNAKFMPSKFLIKRHKFNSVNFFTSLELAIDEQENVSVKEKEHIFFPFLKDLDRSFDHSYSSLGQVHVFGPCNGILCLDKDDETVLWNPATREVKFLQPSTLALASGAYLRISHVVAFGYDPKNDDYKVLKSIFDDQSTHHFYSRTGVYRLELYSLKKNEWRLLPNGVSFPSPSDCNMCINGIYHISLSDYDGVKSFDLVDEVLTCTRIPKCLIDNWDNKVTMTPVDNHLGVVRYMVEDKFFEIWVLKEIGVVDSWTKQATVGPVDGVTRFLGFWKKMMLVEIKGEQIAVYNPKNEKLRTLQFNPIYEHEMEFNNWLESLDPSSKHVVEGVQIPGFNPIDEMQFINYVESLVPINGRQEHEKEIVHSLS